jgi:uncharacterized coiled-coil protein SlyX
MLKGEAKTSYMREYMRRRRAGQSQREPLKAGDTAKLKAAELKLQLEAAQARIHELETAPARKGEAHVDPATLSMTAQQKLDTAIRQEMRRLGASFQQQVRDEVRKQLEETILPHYRKEQAEAKKVMEARKGIMDKATYNLIWSCLHPDSRKSTTDGKLSRAFNAFESFEKRLLKEKDAPTTFSTLPETMAEWDAMRAKASAERRAKRAASKSAVRPR